MRLADYVMDFLVSKGCKLFQGYYFSKPIPVDEFEDLIMSKDELIIT